jgi:hypothetical protein
LPSVVILMLECKGLHVKQARGRVVICVPTQIREKPSPHTLTELELGFVLRPTVSRPVSLGIGPPFGTLDQILSCSSSLL